MGAPTLRGRQHTILPNFPPNCMKLKEFGPPGEWGTSLAPPFRSSTAKEPPTVKFLGISQHETRKNHAGSILLMNLSTSVFRELKLLTNHPELSEISFNFSIVTDTIILCNFYLKFCNSISKRNIS